MKNRISLFLVYSVLLGGSLSGFLSGCGTNNDLIDILNSSTTPEFNNFTTTTLTNGSFGAGFTSSTPYWIFNSGGYGTYFAPSRGIVGEVAASSIVPGTSAVTIIHSGRVATRVHGVSIMTARSGDPVVAGGAVGTFLGTTQIAFQVFLDGAAVCPLSYMSATFRNSFAIGAYNPCR